MKRRVVLLTGGAGFIGSHICVELVAAGHQPVILDNFHNSNQGVLERLKLLTNADIPLIRADIRDRERVRCVLQEHLVTDVIHLAGLKAVGESSINPLLYWSNNVAGSLCLLEAMKDCGVRSLVFSSSCTVYGEPETLPVTESHPLRGASPYGRTKLAIEEMIRDLSRSDPSWSVFLLRYFNPVGAHPSGLIGEDPNGVPNNLMPYIAQVAARELPELKIWGGDYETRDGTGVRDYIHVVDLAIAHVRAMERIGSARCHALNLGTGIGHSVLEVVNTFEKATGVSIPRSIHPRRPGDVCTAYADPSSAREVIGWTARRTLEEMCADSWRWKLEAMRMSRS